MNPGLARTILATMALSGSPAEAGEQLSGLRHCDWEAALSWMRRSGLALYWYSLIKSGKAAGAVPDFLRMGIEKDADENRVRLVAMTEEFRTLLALFDGMGMAYAVLKGFALTPEYCADPMQRSQFDFDFLVDPETLPQFDSRLQQAGFARKPRRSRTGPSVYFHLQRRPEAPDNLDNIFSADLYRSVEIHTSLWEPRADNVHLALSLDGLRRVQRRTWGGVTFLSLAPEETLVFQVLHIFRHILNNHCRLSHIFELATFLAQHDERDPVWAGFESTIQKDCRVSEATGVVFSLARGLFKVNLPPEIRAFTTDQLSPAAAFWVRRHGLGDALHNFSASKSSLYWHRLFIENDREWREIRRQRLFPFKMPAGFAQATKRGRPLRNAAGNAQFGRLARRAWFHVTAALKYAWGLPEWRRACRRNSRAATSPGTNRSVLRVGSTGVN